MSQVHDTPSCRLVGARRSARLLLSLAFAFASLPLCRLARAQGSPTPVLPPPASPARADAAPVAEVSPLALEGGAPSGALTAEIVGRRAAETSYVAKAAQESVRSAAARVDQAWVAFLPRLSTRFSYSRLSEFTPRTFGEGSLVGTPQPAGTPNPTPTQAVGLAFPIVPDNWTLEAQLVVPISDADVLATYDTLTRGSRNHLRSFYGKLVAAGGSYTPKHLDAASFKAIVDSAMERGP